MESTSTILNGRQATQSDLQEIKQEIRDLRTQLKDRDDLIFTKLNQLEKNWLVLNTKVTAYKRTVQYIVGIVGAVGAALVWFYRHITFTA